LLPKIFPLRPSTLGKGPNEKGPYSDDYNNRSYGLSNEAKKLYPASMHDEVVQSVWLRQYEDNDEENEEFAGVFCVMPNKVPDPLRGFDTTVALLDSKLENAEDGDCLILSHASLLGIVIFDFWVLRLISYV